MKDDFKERFDYLMSLSNKNLRKEIENSNWVFILQELRYAGETIKAYENMRKEARIFIKIHGHYDIEMGRITSELTDDELTDLLNILNKVGEDNE